MINMTTVKSKVYAVIRKYMKAEATIIWEHQNEARPPKPFATLHFITGPIRLGHDVEEVDPDDDMIVAKGVRELTLSVNYFGLSSMQELETVKTSLGLPTAREILLKDVGLVFVSESDVRDLTALQENRSESRAQVDFKFRINGAIKDLDSTVIESATLVNEIDNSEITIP